MIDKSDPSLTELRSLNQSEFASLSEDLVGFWRTQTICTAVELGIFEAIPATGESLASRLNLIPDRVFRLLRALGELGLVERRSAQWHLTSRGAYLQYKHPLTLAHAAVEYGRHLGPSWARLGELMRPGRNQSPLDLSSEVAADPCRASPHHHMLRSYALHDYKPVPDALALNGLETVIDAGGGSGTLANYLLNKYPRLQMILLDLPEIINLASAASEKKDRLKFVKADIFRPWPVAGDAIVLSRVLHDWDDEAAEKILINARGALNSNGQIFVVEMLLAETEYAGALCDLHLLAVTGGRERTLPMYKELLRRTGFTLTDVHRLPTLPAVLVGKVL